MQNRPINSIKLRKWLLDDIDNVAAYANNKRIADNLRNVFPNPYTRKDAESFIQSCMSTDESTALLCAIEVDGEAVGSIGLFLKDDIHCKNAEIGYWLAEPFWGRGIVTRSIKQICELGFSKYDIVRIYAEAYAQNSRSRKALENAGFTLEGILKKSVYKNGKLYDSCIYALVK